MPRLAGSEPGYLFAVIDRNTGLPTDWTFRLDSVTTILKETLGKPAGALAWWGYRVGMRGAFDALEEDPGAVLEAATPEDLEALLKTRGVSPNMSLDSAGSRGTAAHTILELLAEGESGSASAAAEGETSTFGTSYGWAVIKWWNEKIAGVHPPENLVSERPVWSLSKGYAGTLDLAIRLMDGSWEVLDLKSHKPASGFTKPGHGAGYISDVIQIGAYRTAWEEMGLGQTTCQRVVIARENGEYLEDAREVEPSIFERLLDVYRIKQRFEGGEK